MPEPCTGFACTHTRAHLAPGAQLQPLQGGPWAVKGGGWASSPLWVLCPLPEAPTLPPPGSCGLLAHTSNPTTTTPLLLSTHTPPLRPPPPAPTRSTTNRTTTANHQPLCNYPPADLDLHGLLPFSVLLVQQPHHVLPLHAALRQAGRRARGGVLEWVRRSRPGACLA